MHRKDVQCKCEESPDERYFKIDYIVWIQRYLNNFLLLISVTVSITFSSKVDLLSHGITYLVLVVCFKSRKS